MWYRFARIDPLRLYVRSDEAECFMLRRDRRYMRRERVDRLERVRRLRRDQEREHWIREGEDAAAD